MVQIPHTIFQNTQDSYLGDSYHYNKINIKEFDVKLEKLNFHNTFLVYDKTKTSSLKDLCDKYKTVIEEMMKEKDVDRTLIIKQKTV